MIDYQGFILLFSVIRLGYEPNVISSSISVLSEISAFALRHALVLKNAVCCCPVSVCQHLGFKCTHYFWSMQTVENKHYKVSARCKRIYIDIYDLHLALKKI